MGPEWVSIIALVALFVIGTALPINMGPLAYVAAWLVGGEKPPAGAPWTLMLANKPDTIEEPVYYKQILTYSVLVTLIGPFLVWAALVLPGW